LDLGGHDFLHMNKLAIKEHFDSIAESFDKDRSRFGYYHKCVFKIYKTFIPEGQNVLEIGCATGDLLNALNPSRGVGVDLSDGMVNIASNKYPQLHFHVMSAEDLKLNEKFDYVLAANVLDYLEDIGSVLDNLKSMLVTDGKIVITLVNPIWELNFRFWERFYLKTPAPQKNLITNKDMVNLFETNGFEVIKERLGMFFPLNIPIISQVFNFIIPEIPMLRQLCAVQYIVAKPKRSKQALSCSVIIPCYNEKSNIADCLRRIPPMGVFTEAIVVDDGSTDMTSMMVCQDLNNAIRIKLISYQPNQGKGHAVKAGFDSAQGDVLMILDADMTVIPEDLPKFFKLFEEGKADFVNGTRMVYPMEKKAMNPVNYIGNKIFNLMLSWIMEQRVSDTLCGTKAMFKKDYKKIHMNDKSWGDFDLLFGAAKLCLKLREVPIHYKMRIADESKMKVIKHGWPLLMEVCQGMKELKFDKVC